MIEEGKNSKDAALITSINIGTAQYYVKKYNDDEERRLTTCHRESMMEHSGKLTEAQTRFLIDFIDKYSSSVLADIKAKFCDISRIIHG